MARFTIVGQSKSSTTSIVRRYSTISTVGNLLTHSLYFVGKQMTKSIVGNILQQAQFKNYVGSKDSFSQHLRQSFFVVEILKHSLLGYNLQEV